MGSSVELFRTFKSDIETFVETGTFYGGVIESALKAGLKKAYSCEINEEFFNNAKSKHADNPNVHIELNPSYIALKNFFDIINERCLIFLDGHFMAHDGHNPSRGFGQDTVKEGLPPSPLIQEIDIISNHHIKNHVILIDDTQDFGTWVFGGITFEEVKNKIMKINDYKIAVFGNTVCFYF